MSFFTSYIMGQSGSAQLTLMADQYSLWRTARAIAVALYLLTIEAIFGFIVGIEGLFAVSKFYLFVWCLAILGLGVTTLIIRGTYSRLCFTLFSLLYMVCEKQIVPQKNADRAP